VSVKTQLAVRLAGAAAAARAAAGSHHSVDAMFARLVGQPDLVQRLAPARAALSQQEQDVAWASGQAMTVGQALAYALEETSGSTQ
jgi:hypothetical protein